MEFYFSDSNLHKDRFLKKAIEATDDGCELYKPRQVKKCLQACTKYMNSHRPAHVQKSHPGLCFPLIHSIVSTDSGRGH